MSGTLPPALPRILPACVPWKVAPSSSIKEFRGEEGSVVVRLIANFGQHVLRREQAEIERQGRSLTDEEHNNLGVHLLEIRFHLVSLFRMMPPTSRSR